jgi:hypothetical protein
MLKIRGRKRRLNDQRDQRWKRTCLICSAVMALRRRRVRRWHQRTPRPNPFRRTTDCCIALTVSSSGSPEALDLSRPLRQLTPGPVAQNHRRRARTTSPLHERSLTFRPRLRPPARLPDRNRRRHCFEKTRCGSTRLFEHSAPPRGRTSSLSHLQRAQVVSPLRCGISAASSFERRSRMKQGKSCAITFSSREVGTSV